MLTQHKTCSTTGLVLTAGKKQMVSWDRFECCFGQGYIVSCETPECESTFMVVPKPRIEADLLRFEKAE